MEAITTICLCNSLLFSDLSDELLERKIQLCQELLEVGDILEPGHSKFRGSLLYDLHEAMMVQVRRGGGEVIFSKQKKMSRINLTRF
jgi:hypothetical protein